MTGKDARGTVPRPANWKARISLLCGALAVVACCVAVRYLWGPVSASAEAPRPTARPAAPAAAKASISDTPTRSVDPQAVAGQAGAPQVAAVVNGKPISRDELGRECLRRYGPEVLESILNKHLIWQACQKRSVQITEQDVADEVTRMAAKWGLSADRYLQMLQEERNLSPQQYRRDIVWPTLALRSLVADRVQVGQDELQKAFEAEFGPKVKTRMIAVSERSKAELIRAKAVANPEEFGALAKDYSEDEHSASARGIIPPIRKHVGDPQIERVVFALKEGEISPVVQVANQYLVFKCEKQLPETFVSTQQRSIVEERLVDQLREEKMRDAAPELFKKLQSESQVVNVLNNPQLQQKMPGVAATVNGQAIGLKELTDECLARHGVDVLDGEINRRLLLQELERQQKNVNEQDIDQEIARAADAYGYLKPDGSPDIDAWLKSVTQEEGATVELYVRDAVWPTVALKKLVGSQVEVTQDDLQKGFESNYGERVEVLAMVLSSQRQAQQVWEMARDNPTDQFFGELANQYSIEPVSRSNYGKVPPIRRHGGQPTVEEEAFRLQAGELSGIITVGDKHIILRCLGRTKPVVERFEDVKDELYKDIHEKKLRLAMVEKFDQLKETAQIDNLLAGTSQASVQTQAALTARSKSSSTAAVPTAARR